MTRALQKVLRVAFEEMHIDQVHSSYFVDNLASKRVHEKLGFVPRTHGRHCDMQSTAISLAEVAKSHLSICL